MDWGFSAAGLVRINVVMRLPGSAKTLVTHCPQGNSECEAFTMDFLSYLSLSTWRVGTR